MEDNESYFKLKKTRELELTSREILENNPIEDMEEYGTHNQPKETWSDDSSMILATIDSMYNNQDTFLLSYL